MTGVTTGKTARVRIVTIPVRVLRKTTLVVGIVVKMVLPEGIVTVGVSKITIVVKYDVDVVALSSV